MIGSLDEAQSLQDICDYIEAAEEALGEKLEADNAELLKVVNSYSAYKDNYQLVKDNYEGIEADSQAYYDLLKEFAITYYHMLIDTVGLDDYNTWNEAMDDFYDAWNDSFSDFYDAWNDAYGDLYDEFEEIISESDADYSEQSETWTTMCNDYSTGWKRMYNLYSKSRSYMYTYVYSSLKSMVWAL